MRICFGVLLIAVGVLGGLALAAYVGGYLMLYGGIIGAIQACQNGVNATTLAGNILKAIFWEFGLLAGFVGFIPGLIGAALLED